MRSCNPTARLSARSGDAQRGARFFDQRADRVQAHDHRELIDAGDGHPDHPPGDLADHGAAAVAAGGKRSRPAGSRSFRGCCSALPGQRIEPPAPSPARPNTSTRSPGWPCSTHVRLQEVLRSRRACGHRPDHIIHAEVIAGKGLPVGDLTDERRRQRAIGGAKLARRTRGQRGDGMRGTDAHPLRRPGSSSKKAARKFTGAGLPGEGQPARPRGAAAPPPAPE